MASQRNLPNIITLSRMAACPAIFFLALSTDGTVLAITFGLFLAAALSDVWDGYLARKHNLISDLGKLLDPIADKLLLVSTLVPIYIVSHRPAGGGEIPWWGELPLWVLVVLLGRELMVTLLRGFAVRQGVVIAADRAGKYKALLQNVFMGAVLLWYALVRFAEQGSWSGAVWDLWVRFHSAVIGLALLLALVLTIYSMGLYFWRNRGLAGSNR
ncbi:MAG: CDP-diacylglycerol--glycerol-3-phosphate 3-phosphatidyltransferase [Gammaproteobacteria bacterium]|nr:CDP-diacylglycerol--glycerol-3-phosphate 3-phosphatidyltransferase [Gammaproteobacteria bacterium]MYC97749.1 CDP-diacylglycerol--glycerol-3-phosphate 3-phosphatidyltransferase [Gammaproteobacteria bacterium]